MQGLNESMQTLYPSNFRVKKLYFHWLTRGQASLQWLAEEVSSLATLDPESRIEMTVHLTDASGKTPFQRRLLLMAEQSAAKRGRDAVSGLRHSHDSTQSRFNSTTRQPRSSLTQLGRPNWDTIFSDIKQAHPNETIGVFYCGNPTLEKMLRQQCDQWSDKSGTTRSTTETWFRMHSEKF